MLFLHWGFSPEEIQKKLPPGLFVDTFDKKAYVGITSFSLEAMRFAFFSFLPSMPDSLEIDLRTYVYDESGTPGVWFFSLDINSLMIAEAARGFLSLPYHYADITLNKNETDLVDFRSLREGKNDAVEIAYRIDSSLFEAKPESLEFFLIERYIVFVDKENQIKKGRIHHKPYSLGKAEVLKWDDHLFQFEEITSPLRKPDHIIYSPGVDVEVFGLQD